MDCTGKIRAMEHSLSRCLVGLRLFILLCLSIPIPVAAHHSHAEFSNETKELFGVLESIVWRNPHPAMILRVAAADGDDEIWRIQVQGNVNGLGREGVNGAQFSVGDRLRIAGHLSTRRPELLLATRANYSDGTEIILGPDESTGSALYRGAASIEVLDETEQDRGLFRVWTVASRFRVQDLPLRNEARAAKAVWDSVIDDPQRGCQPLGMPGAMMSPHPVEFRENGDDLLLLLEEWGAIRTIHMTRNDNPKTPTPSLLGFSTGRWEGATLVVRTAYIDYPYMDEHGTPQSEAAEIVERFSLSDDGHSLDWSATVTDPGVFREPVVVFTTRWDWIPGEEIQVYDCQEVDRS